MVGFPNMIPIYLSTAIQKPQPPQPQMTRPPPGELCSVQCWQACPKLWWLLYRLLDALDESKRLLSTEWASACINLEFQFLTPIFSLIPCRVPLQKSNRAAKSKPPKSTTGGASHKKSSPSISEPCSIWENPAYGINAQFVQCAFLVA